VSDIGKIGINLIDAYEIMRLKRKAKETKVPFF
jgi:hypothetical protein